MFDLDYEELRKAAAKFDGFLPQRFILRWLGVTPGYLTEIMRLEKFPRFRHYKGVRVPRWHVDLVIDWHKRRIDFVQPVKYKQGRFHLRMMALRIEDLTLMLRAVVGGKTLYVDRIPFRPIC